AGEQQDHGEVLPEVSQRRPEGPGHVAPCKDQPLGQDEYEQQAARFHEPILFRRLSSRMDTTAPAPTRFQIQSWISTTGAGGCRYKAARSPTKARGTISRS